MKLALWTRSLVIGIFATSSSLYAQASCFNTAWISKVNANVAATTECPAGNYVNAVYFSHPSGQNYTYQESVSLRCCSMPGFSPNFGQQASWQTKTNLLTEQYAPADTAMTGIAFMHPSGQNFTHQESISTMFSYPIARLDYHSGCQSKGWVSKANTTSVVSCSNLGSFIKAIRFYHESGANLTYQESVGLDCCEMATNP